MSKAEEIKSAEEIFKKHFNLKSIELKEGGINSEEWDAFKEELGFDFIENAMEEYASQFHPDSLTDKLAAYISTLRGEDKHKALELANGFLKFVDKPVIEKVEEDLFICPMCGGDGKETCNNPDHGFINVLAANFGKGSAGYDVARHGCPVCGHDENHKVKNGGDCDICNGSGKVNKKEFNIFCNEYNYDEEPILFEPKKSKVEEVGEEEKTVSIQEYERAVNHITQLEGQLEEAENYIRELSSHTN